MNLFGLTIARTKAVGDVGLSNWAASSRGWFPLIGEAFTGAWQRNIHVEFNSAASFHAVTACQSLIAANVAVLRLKLVEKVSPDVWREVDSPAFSPVLREPNSYQTRVQFWQAWIHSKLSRGNTYGLKERDGRGIVRRVHILNPDRCHPLVAYDGSVFYECEANALASIGGNDRVIIPEREIIHDRMYQGDHPLIGISPIQHAALAATHGSKIQENSIRFFGNNSQPGGILTADKDARISPADAELMKEQWKQNFSGQNLGNVAVLAGGLKFVQLSMSAADAQLMEQHKWAAEIVCGAYHVPPYLVNIGPAPLNNNVQALAVQFYKNCLQILLESAELCMDKGLGIGDGVSIDGRILGTEFDIDNLLRMDSETQMRTLGEGTQRGLLKLNEGRAKLGMEPMDGGDTAYLQEQNWPVKVLADASRQPPSSPLALPPPTSPEPSLPAKGIKNASERRGDLAQRILRSADRHDRRVA